MTHEASQIKKPSPLMLAVIVVILVTGVVLALKNSFFTSDPSDASPLPFSDRLTEQDNQRLVKKVASHLLVNEKEMPQIAIVQDAASLRSQSPYFYKDAEAGDRVLVWSDKAVLYSVSRDLILAVLPVSFSAPSSTSPNAATSSAALPPEERPLIEIRNGSGIAGRARLLGEKLKTQGFTILPATDAKSSYSETLIINVSSTSFPQTMQSLVGMTGGKAASLPAVEGQTKGDILIILGTSSTTPSL